MQGVIMILDKFNMVNMGGIDIVESQNIAVAGLYQRLVESIALCRYSTLYNWKFAEINIPPTPVELVHENGVVTINEAIFVNSNDVVYIQSLEPILEALSVSENGLYLPSDGVYGYSSVIVDVPSGSTILSGSVAPEADVGIDGNIYLQTGILLSDFAVLKESSMTITVEPTIITFDFTGGSSIGGQVYKQIDLTDIDSITYTLTSGHHSYNSYASPGFRPMVILENTTNPAIVYVGNILYASAATTISTNDTAVTNTIDTSALSGNYWLVFCSYGCDSTVTSFSINGITTIASAYVKVSGAWTNLIGADISDVA